MDFSPELQEAVLLRRYKRFLADITLPDGRRETVHCPNTGAMTGCAEPGSRVWYSTSANPKRKYAHTLELVEVAGGDLACINTGRANQLVAEALESGVVPALSGYRDIRREVVYGHEKSRVDFSLAGNETDDRPCYVEVKSVTLCAGDGQGLFPDAVSVRGSKHLRELTQAAREGSRAVMFFCVMHTGIKRVAPAGDIDPLYAVTLAEAMESGVEVLVWQAEISVQGMTLVRELPFSLEA